MLNRVRLFTGLVLFSYVTLHLFNHSFGLWSLNAMSDAKRVLHLPWNNPLGQLLLYGSLLTHLALAFYALYRRRSLRMGFGEAVQLTLGLAIFPLLFPHIVGTRVLFSAFDARVDYLSVLMALWPQSGFSGARQLLALLAAWIHGCIGVHYWLALKPYYPAVKPYLYAGALLLPTLSSLGYIQASKDLFALAADPDWLSQTRSRYALEPATVDTLQQILYAGLAAFFMLLLLTLLLRALRLYRQHRAGLVSVRYDNGRRLQFPAGRSLLEASREAGIPHASVCGGRGRCSTCRVRIVDGAEHLPEPSAAETEVLERVRAGKRVRLACQTRPRPGAEISLIRILPPGHESVRDGFARPRHLQGEEINIAILFADLRSFTRLSEKKLPYDVVFLLNQYFHSMGAAIEQSGGRIDKFIGDGIMALFGVDADAATGSRQALAAARSMSEGLSALNRVLEHDLERPLRIGIGIHTGAAIVGEMGYAAVRSVTAIGDAVNTASRLEPLTKDYRAELVVSAAVAEHAGVALEGFERREVAIRGRVEPLAVYIVPSASALP